MLERVEPNHPTMRIFLLFILTALALALLLPACGELAGGGGSNNKFFREAVGNNDAAGCLERIDLKGIDKEAPEGEEDGQPALRRLVIAIDASGSMGAKSGGSTKMASAREAAANFLADVPEDVQVGLIAFGHRGDNDAAGKDASCAGVEIVYPLAEPNRDGIARALEGVEPVGWTPLASAIERAAGQMKNSDRAGEQVVWVVSDGKETCGGDPVAAARDANSGPLKLTINIVGFDLSGEDRAQLKEVASAGGGEFLELSGGSSGDVVSAFEKSMAKMGADVDAASARINNALETGWGKANTGTCLNNMMNGERMALNNMATDVEDGEQGDYDAAKKLLDERHNRIKQLKSDYETAANERDRAKAAEINNTLYDLVSELDEG